MNFTPEQPAQGRRDITIRGGAEARGVGIGDTLADIKAKFKKRKVDHSQEDVFRAHFVLIPKAQTIGGKMMFAIDVDTKKITLDRRAVHRALRVGSAPARRPRA